MEFVGSLIFRLQRIRKKSYEWFS